MATPAATRAAASGLEAHGSERASTARERIESEHQRLGELLRSLARSHDLSRVQELLDELDRLLVAHFAGEEGDEGLHRAIGESAAHRLPNLQQLYDEHRAILARLDGLRAENARLLEVDVRRIREGIAELVAALRRHEAREDELFGEAYYSELGRS